MGTLSPQPEDILNILLQVKDNVNSRLLEETKTSVHLANALSTFEDQLRLATEKTIKEIKLDFETRRRKQKLQINRLEDANKSLTRSERRLRKHEGHQRSYDVKKAKGRIKNVKFILTEQITSQLENGIQNFVANNVLLLCEQLRQLSVITHHNVGERSGPDTQRRGYYSSESNSEDENSECLEIQKQSNYFIARSRQSPSPDLHLKTHPSCAAIKQTKTQNQDKCRHNDEAQQASQAEVEYKVYNSENHAIDQTLDAVRKNSETKHLNGVHLFSSDSDSFDDDPFGEPNTQSTGEYSSETLTGDSIDRQIIQSTQIQILSNDKNEQFETVRKSESVKVQTESEHSRKHNSHSKKELFNTHSVRTGKRLLPKVPKQTKLPSQKLIEPRMPKEIPNEVLPEPEIIDVLNTCIAVDTLDLEEKTFKETASTVSKEIIHKIKSKYTFNAFNTQTDHDVYKPKDENSKSLQSHNRIFQKATALRKYKSTSDLSHGIDIQSEFIPNNANNVIDKRFNMLNENIRTGNQNGEEQYINHTQNEKHNHQKSKRSNVDSPNVYKGTLVHISDTETVNGAFNDLCGQQSLVGNTNGLSDPRLEIPVPSPSSIVVKGIRKFEKKTQNTEPRAKGTDQRITTRTKTRSLSTTGITNNGYKYKANGNNALRARHNSVDLADRFERKQFENELAFNIPPKCNSTEFNLGEICSRDSARSIRDKWRKRRSTSLTRTLSAATNSNTYKIGPVYERKGSFKTPCHGSQCHVSGLLTFITGHVVILDERHGHVSIYDGKYNLIEEIKLKEVPSGITKCQHQSFAIAFPYKSKIVIYDIAQTKIAIAKELTISCPEWITDLSFANGVFYVLCKIGHIHLLNSVGVEEKCLTVGMNGKLLVHHSGRRFYITGEGRVSRFDSDGNFISSRTDVDAYSTVLINERPYVGDRRKNKIMPLSDFPDVNNLVNDTVSYVSAISSSVKDDVLLIGRYQENMSVDDTREILVYQLIC